METLPRCQRCFLNDLYFTKKQEIAEVRGIVSVTGKSHLDMRFCRSLENHVTYGSRLLGWSKGTLGQSLSKI